jgi:MFS family permease
LLPLLCVLPAELLDTQHAGIGLAIFNAVGAAIGGFSGPWTVGAIVGQVGSFVPAMVYMGMFLLAAGLMLVAWGTYEQVCKRRTARLALPAEEELADGVAGSLNAQQQQQQQQQDAAGKKLGATVPADRQV